MSLIQAAVIDQPGGTITLTRIPEPAVTPGQILVRSAHVGICGSDVSLLKGTRPASFSRYPVTPGHEWSGVVEAVGAGVEGVTVGDRIACRSMWWCGVCGRCREGRPQLCREGYREVGFTMAGGLAELVTIEARQAVVLPPEIPLLDAALLEPTAVMTHALLRLPQLLGRRVTIIGDGTLGLLGVQLARLAGASRVSLIGLDEHRLRLGRQFGADETADASAGSPTEVGRGADVVLDCAGAVGTLEQAIGLCATGGTVAVVGVVGGAARAEIPADIFVVEDITVTGVLASTSASWDLAMRLAGSGRLDLASLVTHRFPTAAVVQAFAQAAAPEPGQVKIIIDHEK
ncbi:MAG: zinc-dependent alcohol dehydrogenase [Jatrophihabitans sp.]